MNLEEYMDELMTFRFNLYLDLQELLENKGVEVLVQTELIKKLSLEDFDNIQSILNKIDKVNMDLEELSVKSVNITNKLNALYNEGYI